MIVAIWNPAAGRHLNKADLAAALPSDAALVTTTAEDPGPGQAVAAVEQGARTVIVCGGDGTVRACLEPLANTATALDIVPLGTGNLLARNLGIPPGLEATKGSGTSATTAIDLGRVNGEAFSVMAGSGFDAWMIRDADRYNKARLGVMAYAIAGVRNLNNARARTVIEVDGQRVFDGRTTMVLVANHGTITGGFDLFPDARPDDGVLDVAILQVRSVLGWVPVVWRLLRRRPQRSKDVQRARGTHITVDTAKPRAWELDGEERPPTTNLEFSVEPAALHVHHRTNR